MGDGMTTVNKEEMAGPGGDAGDRVWVRGGSRVHAAAALLFVVGSVGGAVGCLSPTRGAVRVPPDLLRGGEYGPAGEPPRSRYVVRMTDGQRDWEMQLPEIATAYEVSVPLKGKPATPLSVDLASLTAADREIIEQRQAEEGDKPGAGGEDGAAPPSGQVTGAVPGAAAQKKPPSYLLTLARVKELYRTRNYEVALIELVELERAYPNDERILSMKGTLHLKLGNRALARDAWTAALGINPYNLAVLEAMQRLDKKGE